MFISVEGVDGAGKSTQVAALGAALTAEGIEVVTVRPEDTALGAELRSLLLSVSHQTPVLAWVEALLFTSARAQLVAELVAPALARGAVVVADRYVDSTLAYQGGGRGIDLEALRQLHRDACGDLWPDLTVLLTLDPGAVATRQTIKGLPLDRIEQAPPDFHQAVASAFASLAGADPGRFVCVDASRDQDTVAADVRAAVDRALGVRARQLSEREETRGSRRATP